VWVRVSQGVRLEALSPTGAVIGRHVLSETKGATLIDPAHYEGLRKDTPRTRVVLVEAFQRRFPDQQAFLDGLLAQQKLGPARHLRGILELAQQYAPEALRTAFRSAGTYNTYSLQFVRGVLQHDALPAITPATLATTRVPVPRLEVKRDLHTPQGVEPFRRETGTFSEIINSPNEQDENPPIFVRSRWASWRVCGVG